MAELGTYYITIMPSMNKFTGAVKSALGDLGESAGKSVSTSMWDVLKGSALGTMVGNLASALGSEIASGIGVGINRIDTLKNYPRVMEALGYSTAEADTSVQLIMKHLDGLPTTTQDMVTLTQSIADSTGDLDLATRAALGFNDMMLANGASAGEMTQAMGVFNRVLGKGNATTAQWMSLQSVMPAQLNMVARELMGESASAEDLREALNNGDIAWNDFLGAIVKLDQEGSGAVASFADQARANVDGIGTALVNLPNRIGQGWASIFDAIGRENISGPINKMSYAIKDAFDRVAEGIRYLKEKIGETSIVQNAATVLKTLGDAIAGILSNPGVDGIKRLADGLIGWVDGALKWLADHGEVVTAAVWGIAGALSMLAGWKLGEGIVTLFTTLQTFGAAIAATNPFLAIAAGIGVAVTALYGFFTQTETGRAILEMLRDKFKELWTKGKEVFSKLTTEAKKFVDAAVKKFNEMVSKGKAIWNTLKTVISTVISAIVGVVTRKWEEIRTSHDKAINAVKVTFTTIMNNLKTAASTVWNTIKSTFETALTAIHTTVTNVLNILKTIWDNTLGKILSTTQTSFNGVKNTFSTVSSGITTIWNNLSSALPKTFQGIADKASSTFNSMRDKVTNAFSSMKNNASSQMDSLNSAASTKASKIASHFNGLHPKITVGVSYPYLASVYSSIQSKAALLSGGKVANLYWAAKGGVFDVPTVIGIGEKGREAAIPLNDATYQEMARGIVGQMEGKGQASVLITGNTFNVRNDDDIERIADAIAVRIQRQGRGSM